MAFEEWQSTPEIGKDDIGPEGKRNTVGGLLEKLDSVGAAVGGGNLTSHLNDFTRFDGIDPTGAKLAREHRENTRPRADFNNDGTLTNGFTQGLNVGVHANAICEHRAVTAQAIHKLVVTRGRASGSACQHPSRIGSYDPAEVKNGRGVS